MFKKILASVGLSNATASAATANPPYAPYASDAANAIYNLLFCDDDDAFNASSGQKQTPWQAALFSMPADVPQLQALASDTLQEGRVRYLAFSKLRRAGKAVPPKVLLGVIIEVPLAGGLDALAAFSEGGVRYVNQSGKLIIIEGVDSFLPMVKRLFAASELIVSRIGPWDKPRRSPPRTGDVRLTFLVSDGLYFGEGPMPVMQREPMAGPVIQQATELLLATMAAGTE